MGKTRDLFKKIRDTKGTFHGKMGTIKDRNGTDLTEAEDINESPVQVRCRIQDAWRWCTGMTQRDGTGREVEEGAAPDLASTSRSPISVGVRRARLFVV